MIAHIRKIVPTAFLAVALAASAVAAAQAATRQVAAENGIVKVKSAYGVDETIDRRRAGHRRQGHHVLHLVDQHRLAADAGIKLRRSSLLIFGNPALGSQFMTSNPVAGIDWPVRLLVVEDEKGDVWAVYTDFAWIARRYTASRTATPRSRWPRP